MSEVFSEISFIIINICSFFIPSFFLLVNTINMYPVFHASCTRVKIFEYNFIVLVSMF